MHFPGVSLRKIRYVAIFFIFFQKTPLGLTFSETFGVVIGNLQWKSGDFTAISEFCGFLNENTGFVRFLRDIFAEFVKNKGFIQGVSQNLLRF